MWILPNILLACRPSPRVLKPLPSVRCGWGHEAMTAPLTKNLILGDVSWSSPLEKSDAPMAPLVVDLDGTLTPTDTLVESVIQLIKQSPLNLLKLPFWLVRGRAAFKEKVASLTAIDPALLPYRPALLAYLQQEKTKGRLLVLATAAHRSVAEGVAAHLGLFDAVLATDVNHNLKGKSKLDAIRARVGEKFVYAGDSRVDMPIWLCSEAAILVGASPRLARSIRQQMLVEREFTESTGNYRIWVKALRVHQWVKNLLLFVPLLTAFSFTKMSALTTVVIAFLAFSFAASATYIINDLWDLQSDRRHPRKRFRPFACASLPILKGLAAAAALMTIALIVALAISKAFFFMLVLYVVLTSAYSWVLKEYVLIDAIMLSILYTLRIIAGAVAIGVSTSSWLLAFSVFIFLSLALVKRCSELVSLDLVGSAATQGRDYRVTDLAVLWPLGVGAALSSVVVFGLFISATDTQERYAAPTLLWFVALGLIYWLTRLWIKTSRGEMHDDPIIYALKDAGSRITIVTMIITMVIAHLFNLSAFL